MGGLLVVVGTGTVIGLLVVIVVVVIGGGTGRVVVVIGGGTIRVVVVGGTGGRMVAHLPAMQIQSASQSFSVSHGSPGRKAVSSWKKVSCRRVKGGRTQAMSWPDAAWRCRVCGMSCGLARGGRLDGAPGVCALVVAADEVAITVSVCLAIIACWMSVPGGVF